MCALISPVCCLQPTGNAAPVSQNVAPPPSSPVTGARTASSTGGSNHLALKIALPVALGVALALALVLCCCCFLYVSMRVPLCPAWRSTSSDVCQGCTCAVCNSLDRHALVLVLPDPHWHLLGSTSGFPDSL